MVMILEVLEREACGACVGGNLFRAKLSKFSCRVTISPPQFRGRPPRKHYKTRGFRHSTPPNLGGEMAPPKFRGYGLTGCDVCLLFPRRLFDQRKRSHHVMDAPCRSRCILLRVSAKTFDAPPLCAAPVGRTSGVHSLSLDS